MTKDLEKIIGKSDYLILKNGQVLEGSIKDTTFKKDITLKLIHFIDQDTNFKLNLESQVRVHLEEIYYEVKNNVKINVEINCHKNSYLEYLSFKKNDKSENISVNVNTYLYEKAYIKSKNITSFDSKSTFKQNLYLIEENSNAETLDIIINSSGEVQNFDFDTHHQVENTFSTMRNYCISKKDSIIYINTLGKIIKGASKSDLSQKTKGLILDKNSQISANPLLLIDEYDCLASHGASIGAIDEEELYYLMSRGLTKEDSERLIVEGFIHPFIEGINDESLKSYSLGYVKKFL